MTPPTTPSADPSPEPDRTWRVGVLLFDGFEPLDAFGPAEVFWSLPQAARVAGVDGLPRVDVALVAATEAPVTASYGVVVHPTTTYAACPPLDLLIVPGGGAGAALSDRWGVQHFRQDGPTLDLLRRQAGHAEVIASVCTGAFVLAGAGLLAGRRATTHWRARPALVEAMAERDEPFELVEARVVDDRAVVTAGGVSAGIDLGLHIVARVFGEEHGRAVASYIEHTTPVSAA